MSNVFGTMYAKNVLSINNIFEKLIPNQLLTKVNFIIIQNLIKLATNSYSRAPLTVRYYNIKFIYLLCFSFP